MYPNYNKYLQANPFNTSGYHPQVIGDPIPRIETKKPSFDDKSPEEIAAIIERNRLYSEKWEMLSRFPIAPIDRNSELLIYPKIAAAVIHQHYEAECRCWMICKAIDNEGKGWIRLSEYKEFMTNHWVCYQTSQHWLKRALEYGWITTANKVIYILSIQNVSKILGLKKTGKDYEDYGKPVVIKIEDFLKRKWHCYFYAAVRKQHERRPISQEKLNKLGYMCRRTQSNYLSQLEVVREKNFVDTGMKPDEIYFLWREYGNKYFVTIEGQENVFVRVSDRVFVDDSIARKHVIGDGSKPPLSDYAIILQHACPHKFHFYLSNEQEENLDCNRIRLFHDNYESAKRLDDILSKSNISNADKPDKLFYPIGNYGNIKLWDFIKVRK